MEISNGVRGGKEMRKKLSIILVVISVFGLLITTSAFAANVTLCVNGNTIYLIATPLGSIGGASIYEINGWYPYSKNIVIDGTVMKIGPELRWGFQLENAMDEYAAVVWEFVTDTKFNGSGNFQWQTNGEPYGTLSVSPGPCADSAPADTKALGF
jgi:hypothetical protein